MKNQNSEKLEIFIFFEKKYAKRKISCNFAPLLKGNVPIDFF